MKKAEKIEYIFVNQESKMPAENSSYKVNLPQQPDPKVIEILTEMKNNLLPGQKISINDMICYLAWRIEKPENLINDVGNFLKNKNN